MATPQEILEGLKSVKYPGYSRDIVSFGIVRDIEVGTAGVTVTLAPGGASPEAVEEIVSEVRRRVRELSGVENVAVDIEQSQQPQRRAEGPRPGIPGVGHIVAVASGKGGVGKSTLAVNLALALHELGHHVGLLDADVYGPSIGLMLGLSERLRTNQEQRIVPAERFGLKVVSMGLLLQERQPVIWRGPMINKMLTQFLREVEWGTLDFLVLDLPPGTGDAQLTIVQQAPLSGGVIVTTPQDVALLDVQRGVAMFRQVNAPVLGVIENMSYHLCRGCGHRSEIFGHGGGARMAEKEGIPFLGEIPLVGSIRETADRGEPIVVSQPDGPESRVFRDIAARVIDELEAQGRVALPMIH
jgi:ATP-binding protein involved in chromosome partitioning